MQTIYIPADQRKRTTLAKVAFYEKLEIYENKVVGYLDNIPNMTWYFKEYSGIDFVKANMNSQFAQVVFLTGFNSKSRFTGVDFFGAQNEVAVNDMNRILFCSGMFGFSKTNDFASHVASEIRKAFDAYKDSGEHAVSTAISPMDELKKMKELLDAGIVTQQEFDAKKKQLLGL